MTYKYTIVEALHPSLPVSYICNFVYPFNMVLAKSKNAVGLGNSLMNDRFGKNKGADRKRVSAGIQRTDQDGQTVRMGFGNETGKS